MMREEFEKLVSKIIGADRAVVQSEYDTIEICYMNYDNLLFSKERVAEFYVENGMEFFRCLAADLSEKAKTNSLLENQVKCLEEKLGERPEVNELEDLNTTIEALRRKVEKQAKIINFLMEEE